MKPRTNDRETRQLNEAVERALFGHDIMVGQDYGNHGHLLWRERKPGGGHVGAVGCRPFATDRNLTPVILAEIERRGRIVQYRFIDLLIDGAMNSSDPSPYMWRIISLTPGQICRAAVAAVEEPKAKETA